VLQSLQEALIRYSSIGGVHAPGGAAAPRFFDLGADLEPAAVHARELPFRDRLQIQGVLASVEASAAADAGRRDTTIS
jgi:hypothetical protein